MSYSIDAAVFGKRLQLLYDDWKTSPSWNGATALAIVTGQPTEEIRYYTSSSLHLWLLGYEFTDTILVLTKTELHALAGSKKTDLLGPLAPAAEAAGVKLVLHTKPRKEDGAAQMQSLLDALKGSGEVGTVTVGTLPKEKPTGATAEAWLARLLQADLATVDASAGLAHAMAVKDEDEVKNVKKAAFLASGVLTQFMVKEIEGVIDNEEKVRHSKIAEKTEDTILNPSKINIKLKADAIDVAYPPILQSGGTYDPKLSAGSNDDTLSYDVILCQVGARYASYCATVGRTLFVNPTPRQEAEYAALRAAHAAAIAALVEGAPLSAAHAAAVAALDERGQGALVEALGKNVGTGIGLDLRDGSCALTATAAGQVRAGTTFHVAVAATGLRQPAPDGEEGAEQTYAILLADTVVVRGGGQSPEVATIAASKDWEEVAYFLNDDEEEEEAEGEGGSGGKGGGRTLQPLDPQDLAGRRSQRTEQVDFRLRDEERRRQQENQEALLDRVNQATLNMLTKQGDGAGGGGRAGRKVSDIVAYASAAEMATNGTLTVQTDTRKECILVPIYGVMVPFHVLTVKNATLNQDGDHAFIRVTFNYGGAYEPTAKFPGAAFLKELTFRSSDPRHAAKVVQEIKTMRSMVLQRDKEHAERATLVAQERLIRGKARVYSLPDLWMRPAFGGKGRKAAGELQAHANGFRYTSGRGEEVDVMYRNIKHAFFQPAQNEMITLVHFHLIHPIMVGKKKTMDVQFYTEVMDSVQTLEAGRRSAHDPDEIEDEQRERERRNQINHQFSQFVKRVQTNIWEREFPDLNLEFEVPFRELGFDGVPARTTCFIMPTVNCLVELTEMPFTVITLAEVNVVNLERVGFNLRNFDLVIIWKDLDRDVGRIDAIQSKALDTIKDWLTSVDIKYYESKVNLNWKNILKSIKEDPEGFIHSGGWSFLDTSQTDSEEEAEEESEFSPTEGEEESDDDDSSEDESLVDSDEDEEGSDFDEEEEEGMDWDELEKEAAREDKAHHHSEDEDDERPRKRKGEGGAAAGSKRGRH
ncbi:hypothetical protein ACKKBG_A26355 [Auxenochlorella protothecoides x Auxenochlorella symbiontica]